MSNFSSAYEKTLLAEGGYVLTNIQGDRGGQTYAGISRKAWPNWIGWQSIDSGNNPTAQQVRDFYEVNFWIPCGADRIEDQRKASTIYDFAVNAGVSVAVKLAQIVTGTTPDGVIGSKTLDAINAFDADLFCSRYALAKLARYAAIVNRDRSQGKFLLGWVNRTLKDAA
jgi:lysozyme family protein